jgi:hypothetical protein
MSKSQRKAGDIDSTATSDEGQTDGADASGDSLVDDGPSDDQLFELLANQRRRFVLYYLDQCTDDRVSLSTLSEQVAGWENGVDASELEYAERKSVRNSLHQFHLPKLADADIVTYDAEAGEIVLLNDDVIDAYRAVAVDDVSWSAYVVGAGVGAVAVLVLVGVGVLANAGVLAWVLAAVAAIATTATHYATTRAREFEPDPPESEQ